MALQIRTKPKLGMVRIEGWGSLAGCKSEGKILRQDEEFLIVRTFGSIPRDCKFWLDNGKLVGTCEVAGHQLDQEDLQIIRKKLGLFPKDVKINSPSLERSDNEMALQLGTTKKKIKTSSLEKNGKKPHVSPGESVNEVVKRGVGQPKKAEELPESKPSEKKGQPVQSVSKASGIGTGKRGRPKGSGNKVITYPPSGPKVEKKLVRTETDAPRRGRKPSYELPTAGKGEMLVSIPAGVYADLMDSRMPNPRSKKTTEEEKDLVIRMKNAVETPAKAVIVVLNKTAAIALLTVIENSVQYWDEMGVAGGHFKRGMATRSEEIRTHFKLKGAPIRKQTKPLQKAAARVASKKQVVENDEDEYLQDDEPMPVKRSPGRPKLKTKKLVAIGKAKSM